MDSERHRRLPIPMIVGFALLALAAVICVLRFEVTTDITHFLPSGTDRRLAHISRAVADSELSRTIVLTIGGPDDATAAEAATAMAATLRKSRNVAWVHNGVSDDVQRAVYDLYFPRRLGFLSDQPELELPRRLSDRGLDEAARELKRQLALPTAPMIRRLAPADPLLAFPALLERLKQAQTGTLEMHNGQFVTNDGRGVILLGSRNSAFNTTSQRDLQAEIDRAFRETNDAHSSDLDLDQSGAGRFAIASETAIKGDITRISILSTLGVIALFLGLFRSARALGLVLLPLLSGVVGAAAVGLLLFGRLHGLTLAFGSTLIGVCIDYAVHLQCHQALAPHANGPFATLRRIWPALLLGAATTVAGLGGLAWTSLPGIREIALFASTGVLLALGATRLLLPPLLPSKPARLGTVLQRLASTLSEALAHLSKKRSTLAVLPIASVIFCIIALPSLRWVDDISALQNLDAQLLDEDRRVRTQVSHMESGRFVIALGADDEAALQQNDQVFERLRAAKSQGLIGDFRSLHLLLWSAELQRRNHAQLAASDNLVERAREALGREGFRTAMFEPFGEAIAGEPPPPLTYEALLDSSLADMVRPFRITVGDDVAILTFLRDVSDPEAIADRLSDLDDVVYFDQLRFLGGTYRDCRTRTIQLMVVGLIAVFLMVLLRYRRLGLSIAAFAPSLLAAATTLALVTLVTGAPANLLHLLGLLLVLSMGVDYGVFMVESRQVKEELAATAVGVLVACLSTVFAFGLLALSSNPALRAMGLTTGIGVLLSFLLAPTALLLLGEKHR